MVIKKDINGIESEDNKGKGVFYCSHCGIAYKPRCIPKGKNHYHSKECYNLSRRGIARHDLRIREERICPVCGTSYLYGGRNKKSTCSPDCLLIYRMNPNIRIKVKELTNIEASWLAGFFDGEGSVILFTVKGQKNVNLMINFPQSINNGEVLIEINKMLRLYVPLDIEENRKKKEWAAKCQVNYPGGIAIDILRQMLPYLKVKIKQAELAIEFWERCLREGKSDLNWQYESLNKMRELNRRGRREDENLILERIKSYNPVPKEKIKYVEAIPTLDKFFNLEIGNEELKQSLGLAKCALEQFKKRYREQFNIPSNFRNMIDYFHIMDDHHPNKKHGINNYVVS